MWRFTIITRALCIGRFIMADINRVRRFGCFNFEFKMQLTSLTVFIGAHCVVIHFERFYCYDWKLDFEFNKIIFPELPRIISSAHSALELSYVLCKSTNFFTIIASNMYTYYVFGAISKLTQCKHWLSMLCTG